MPFAGKTDALSSEFPSVSQEIQRELDSTEKAW